MRGSSVVFGLALALGSASHTRAQIDFAAIRATKKLEAVRTDDPIVLDGRLDEPAWATAPVGRDFYQQEPVEGALATDQSEVRFLYDDDALYVGGTFFDSSPRGPLTNELKRDFAGRDGDTVAICLDTLNDYNSSNFQVNPAGAQRDSQTYDDARRINNSWDAVWFVKTTQFEGGWTMEVKIPFKSLRFSDARAQSWGMNVFRLIRRKNEVTYWSPQPRQFHPFKPTYYGRLTGLHDIRPGRNLYVKPFYTGALSNALLPNLDRRYDVDGGIDAKYGLSRSLTLDLTYRTDFSQVEVDEQQINLTRFSLFFPEKREFFLENEGAFRIGDQGSVGLRASRRDLLPFFSRRIGLSDDGQPIPILAGARLTGRQGPYSLGMLTIQTERFGQRPGDNFTAMRVARIFGASSIGAFYLGREAWDDPSFNRVAGGDLHVNVRRLIDIDGFAMGSVSNGLNGGAGRAALTLTDPRYTGQLSYTNISPDFRDDLGFIPRKDIGLTTWDAARHFRPQRVRHIFREFTFGTLGEWFENSRHDTLLSRHLQAYAVQDFAGGGSIDTSVDWNYELLTKPFEVSRGILIPPGEYRFAQLRPTLSSNPSRPVSLALGYTGGQFYSGTIQGYSAGVQWRPNPHFATSGDYQFNNIDLPEGRFDTRLARFRVDCSFTTAMFLNAFVQYNSASRTWTTNVRYRLIYRPLSDLYLVFNETRPAAGPVQRTVVLKHTLLMAF